MRMLSLISQSAKKLFKKLQNVYRSKKVFLQYFFVAKDILAVLFKASISIMTLSIFMFANAIYSVGMALARIVAVNMLTQTKEQQVKSYFFVGLIIAASSLCYVIYSIRLFYVPDTAIFPPVVAITIALYTFVEFGFNCKEIFRQRKGDELEIKAVRAIGLSSTLLCFVLTQTAILSFASSGNHSPQNALAGMLFGGAALLVGSYVMVSSRMKKKRY